MKLLFGISLSFMPEDFYKNRESINYGNTNWNLESGEKFVVLPCCIPLLQCVDAAGVDTDLTSAVKIGKISPMKVSSLHTPQFHPLHLK